jgi:DNA-binding transcriptional ArsR family regulator
MKNTDQQLNQEITQLHAEFCSALADDRRLLLIYALRQGPRNVSDLTELCGFSQPSVSRHLKILRERGLVKAEREGSTVEYRLADMRLVEALDLLRAIMRDQWAYKAEILISAGESSA